MPSRERVLIVKLDAIGDVIMALPLSRYLAAVGAQVTWLVGRTNAPLVREFGSVSRLAAFDERKLLAGSRAAQLREALRVQLLIGARRYDRILLGHADRRYRALVAAAIGPVTSFGTEIDGVMTPSLSTHYSLEYLKLATRSNEPPDDPEQYVPRISWRGEESNTIVFAPGGARNALADNPLRRWPLAHYRRLAEICIAGGFQVEISGASSDAWVLEAFAGLPVKSTIGNFGLIEFIDMLAERRALVTHDSGPMHMGGIAGTPVVAMFGPTRSEWFFPIGATGQALQLERPLPCQPCYDGKHYSETCQDNRCLAALTPESAFEALRQATNA